jgi:hypothetical protein
MRVRVVGSVCLAILVVTAASAAAAPPPQVLVIGDSVATGMFWHHDAISVMQKGLGVSWEVAVCRTIGGTSCPFDGARPPTLLQVVAARQGVPPTVVVVVGYNDPAPTFSSEVDAAMSALTAAGAKNVIWLTLRESRAPYPTFNTVLEEAQERWPRLVLVDWNAASRRHPSWFQNDYVHLTRLGGLAMAHLAHGAVMRIFDPLHVIATPLWLQKSRPQTMRLQAAGGTPPYSWHVAAGRPPRGFHLLADGTLTTEAGRDASVLVTVTDADGSTANMRVLDR